MLNNFKQISMYNVIRQSMKMNKRLPLVFFLQMILSRIKIKVLTNIVCVMKVNIFLKSANKVLGYIYNNQYKLSKIKKFYIIKIL